MAEYATANKGALYENENKVSLQHPDMTGKINPVCPHCGTEQEYRLSAWWKNTRVGKILSLAITPKEPKPHIINPTSLHTNQLPPVDKYDFTDDDFDDDIPF